MSRYIDADALIEAMGEEPYVWTDSDDEIAERNQWLTDMHIIESAPSIDIVRCKECKWSDWYTTADGEQFCYCMETGNGGRTADDFCSYGEREGE